MEAPTVLVIEDDPEVARALQRELRTSSLTCDVAGSAAEVREAEGVYKVAIVDVNLPDGNGIDLYVELRAAERVACGVFFTATENGQDKARASKLGTVIAKSEGVQAAVSVAVQSLSEV